MDNYLTINGVLLKQENTPEETAILIEYITALDNCYKANERLLKAAQAIQDFKPVYSIQGVDAKQIFTEFTGFNPIPHGTGGRISPLDFS